MSSFWSAIRLHPISSQTRNSRIFNLTLFATFFTAVWLVAARPAPAGQIYQWRDESGTLHFSDAPSSDFPIHSPGETPQEAAPSKPLSPETKNRIKGTAASIGKGVFWKVQQPGGRPSFLLGTIHVEDDRVTTIPNAIQKAFDTADTLILELSLDDGALFQAAASMLYMDGTDLKTILGDDLFNRAVQAMEAYGVPEIALRMMKPWAVMSTLIVPKPKTGNFLDLALYRKAVQSGKTVVGLETVAEQVSALESLPLKDQIDMLRHALDNMGSLPRMVESMIETYLAGDLDRLITLSQHFLPIRDPSLANRFLFRLNDDRNLRMAQRLQPHLNRGNIFVAVGALHLAGENGLIRLLEKQGFTVVPGR